MFQLPGSSRSDFETLIGLEHELRASIGGLGNVDGHDMGSGEMNIFVLTAHPIRVFEAARTLPTFAQVMPKLKVAFREVAGETYEVLHPQGLFDFEVT